MVAWILAVLFLLMAVYLLQDWLRHMKRCTEVLRAEVTEVEERTQNRAFSKKKSYYPVYGFRFRDHDYRLRPKEPSHSNRWSVGEEVTLHFDPEDPEYFYAGKNTGDLIWSIIALLLVALMLAIEFVG